MDEHKKKTIAVIATTPVYLGMLATCFGVVQGNAVEAVAGAGTAISGGFLRGWGYGVDIGISRKILTPLKRGIVSAKERLQGINHVHAGGVGYLTDIDPDGKTRVISHIGGQDFHDVTKEFRELCRKGKKTDPVEAASIVGTEDTAFSKDRDPGT